MVYRWQLDRVFYILSRQLRQAHASLQIVRNPTPSQDFFARFQTKLVSGSYSEDAEQVCYILTC